MTIIEEIQGYRDNPGVNQSQLKRIINIDDPEPERIPGRKRYMETGDIVDSIITIPAEYHQDKFLIVDSEKRPGETMDKLISYVYANRGEETDLHNLTSKIEEAITIEEYVGNAHWNMDQRVEKVIKETHSYWNFLMEASGRTIVLTKEWDICSQIASNLKSSPNTVRFHNENGLTVTSNHQLAVYGTLQEVNCKALLDKCLFNEQARTIQPLDYKVTSSSLREWNRSSRKFRPDIQASFYTTLLKQKYSDWEVLPFAFLVASANPAISPYVYICTEVDLTIGERGASRIKSHLLNEEGTRITVEEDIIYGWRDALEIYKDAIRLGIEDFDIDSFYSQRTKPLDLWS